MLKKEMKFLQLCSFLLLLTSCSSKKNVLYFQDASIDKALEINYNTYTIQPNDILSIVISDLNPEAALVYNKLNPTSGNQQLNNIEIMKLQGYLVSNKNTIVLPVLGEINTSGKTITALMKELTDKLLSEEYLKKPTVDIRLLNAKVTVLGEVRRPGTFNFTEQTLSIPQVLGMAGDLTINGKRNDIKLIRDIKGKRKILKIDLRTSDWLTKEIYYIKPNDVIVVSPNNAKVKAAGYIGNISGLIGVISLLISTSVLLTR